MAGVSSRLSPLTEVSHKATLPVGKRRMLDYQLDLLEAAGLGDGSFVLGHGAPELARLLLQRLGRQRVDLVYNPNYASHNLDRSAVLGLSAQHGPVVYFEGDLLVPPSVLRRVAQSPAEICVALDSSCSSPCVDTMVEGHEGRPVRLRFAEHGCLERMPGDLGELLCFMKLGDAARAWVVSELKQLDHTGPMQLYQVFQRAFDRFETACVDAAGLPWVEVDRAPDLERAARLADAIVTA
ncbi:NTP transferase domain-containing protein [Roseateles sp. DB2]|uniref:NTP transferase domain-containing protein n=1 Tax=Roseateles sp. DB2 TaxID=3453717 RepID=UPI003EEFEB2D